MDRRRTADLYAADALSDLHCARTHERLVQWLDGFARAIDGTAPAEEVLGLSDAALDIERELQRQGDARTATLVEKLQHCLAGFVAAHGLKTESPAANARRRLLCVSADVAFAFSLQGMLGELDVDVELHAPDQLPDDFTRFHGVAVHNDDAALATIERQLRGVEARPALVAVLGAVTTQERMRAYMTGADYVVRADAPLRLSAR